MLNFKIKPIKKLGSRIVSEKTVATPPQAAKSGVLSLLPALSWACLFLMVMLSKGESSTDEKEYQILEGMRPTVQQSGVAFKATEKGLVTMTAKAHLPGEKRKKNREREPARQPLSAVAKGPPGALYSSHPQEEADKSSSVFPVLHRCQLLTPSRGNKQKLTSLPCSTRMSAPHTFRRRWTKADQTLALLYRYQL